MRKFEVLETVPANGKPGRRRYYVNGERVSFCYFYELEQACSRADSFSTDQQGNRWHFRKVLTR